jgi:hypothetical protein
MTCLGNDEPIRQPLVIALAMIMRDEIPNGGPQRFLSEQDHPLQTGFFDAPHESFGESIGESRRLQVVWETPRVGSE